MSTVFTAETQILQGYRHYLIDHKIPESLLPVMNIQTEYESLPASDSVNSRI